MNKEEFLNELSTKLGSLSETDKNEYLDYYSELIDDKLEAGISEEKIISCFGDADGIADNILKTVPVEIDPDITYTENHSVIDCTNRYRMDDGRYNFTIKIPAGTKLKNVIIEITKDYKGTPLFCTNLSYLDASQEYNSSITPDYDYNGGNYSYNGSDYYKLITEKLSENGTGIRLYLTTDEKNYMATDTANKSTSKGNGYWLGELA